MPASSISRSLASAGMEGREGRRGANQPTNQPTPASGRHRSDDGASERMRSVCTLAFRRTHFKGTWRLLPNGEESCGPDHTHTHTRALVQ
uniref:Uncharacterized protein n=1 Tax=Anopheles darlingi TaxID=43151 RepID=A0A2M4CL97_ANODA